MSSKDISVKNQVWVIQMNLFMKSSWLNTYVVNPTMNWSRFVSHVESLGFAVAVGSVCIDDLKMLIGS